MPPDPEPHSIQLSFQFTQQRTGNIAVSCGACGVDGQLDRTGGADTRLLSYRISVTGQGQLACISLSGTVQIDTTTNTFTALVSGMNFVGNGCAYEVDAIRLQKE